MDHSTQPERPFRHPARTRQSAIGIAVSLALSFASATLAPVAFAQTAEGSVYGEAKAGVDVVLSSKDTGVTRRLTVDRSGTYQISHLQPGRYTIRVGGDTVEVLVAIGVGTHVDTNAGEVLETINVVANRIGALDFNSTESNFAFSQDQIQSLPVALDAASVALLAPTVIKGDSLLGAGGLPSFGGSSVAENAYYINGFDVTNLRNFLSYANLPFEAIGQEEVKAGGYGVEYGRSLGGVISIVTKRGTNEWHGGVSLTFEPEALRNSGQNVLDKQPEYAGNYFTFDRGNYSQSETATVYVGGPLIKDKLFIFGLVEMPNNEVVTYAQSQSHRTVDNTPSGMLKIDYNLNEQNSFEATGIYNRARTEIYDWKNSTPFSTTHDGQAAHSWYTTGGNVLIGKYTGAWTDNFTMSALGGRVNDLRRIDRGARALGQDCPVVLDTGLNDVGCWAPPFPSAGSRDPAAPDDKDVRTAWRLDFEYKLNRHTIRAGYDAQKFDSSAAGGSDYTGGAYDRYYVVPSNGQINNVPGFTPGDTGAGDLCLTNPGANSCFVRQRISTKTSGVYSVKNAAWYIEDSWKPTDRLLIYGGLRGESFENMNAEGKDFVKKDNLIAPRLGFSWDATDDRATKMYANIGRYYIPVASNTNIRSTQGVVYTQNYYTYTGVDPRTLAPTGLSAPIGIPQDLSTPIPDSATVADTQLKPMNQDEFILGIQHRFDSRWTVGAKLIYRKVNDGMDDFCDGNAFAKYAEDKGYLNFDAGSLAQCVLVNPGRDVHLAMDVNGDGNFVVKDVPASYLGLPKYKRDYKALELTAERPFDGKWGMRVSYVYSKSQGNAEGYVDSTIHQEDAGITQNFDFASFMNGSDGYLPNDRTHVLKMLGNYAVTDNFRTGATLVVASGRPLSCIGFVPPSVPDYHGSYLYGTGSSAYSTASSYYCLDSTGTTVLGSRGDAGRTPTTAQLDLQFSYTFDQLAHGKLVTSMDIFNVFNSQRATAMYEQRDFSRGTTGSGSGNELNYNYMSPTAFQEPRYVRLTVRYSF